MEAKSEAQSKTRIRKAAFSLMYEGGFGPTSYTDIAGRACVGRPLVQRHFPKKDMFVLDLIDDAASTCERILGEEAPCGGDPHEAALHLAQLYISLLLYDDNMVRLTAEVLADRRFSIRIIDVHFRSSFRLFPGVDEAEGKDACLRSMGATYELMEDRIVNHGALDADDFACQTVALFLALAKSEPYAATYERMKSLLLPEDVVRGLVPRIVASLSLSAKLPAKERPGRSRAFRAFRCG